MNPLKVDNLDYIHFLVVAQKEFTCTEAARPSPEEDAPVHDAFTRLLQRRPLDSEALWQDAEPAVSRRGDEKRMLPRDGRRFDPKYVVFDSWYSGLDSLKKVQDSEWTSPRA